MEVLRKLMANLNINLGNRLEEMPFPGHGRRKEVRAVAEQVLLAM